MTGSVTRPATILGGLPVIATVSFGKDADTPNGPAYRFARDFGIEIDLVDY